MTVQDKEALLKKDPKIKINDQQLKKMARQRTELIKNLFLKEYNTEPDRLIGCSPFMVIESFSFSSMLKGIFYF